MGLKATIRRLLGDASPPPLIERVETLEREMKRIRLEWEEAFDKIDHANRRQAKRARDAEPSSPSRAAPSIPDDWPAPLKAKMLRRFGAAGG